MKLIVFLADGFEEVEAITIVDYLRRIEGLEVETVSINQELEVIGAHKIEVKADRLLSELDSIEDYEGLVIPGGIPGATNLRDDERVIDIIRKMNEENKLISAICAGPIVLEEARVLDGKRVTSYPGFEDTFVNSRYKEEGVVIDENIITARGPALAVELAITLVDYLKGKKEADFLKNSILY